MLGVCMCDVFVASPLQLYICDRKIVYYRILFSLEKWQMRQNPPRPFAFPFAEEGAACQQGFQKTNRRR